MEKNGEVRRGTTPDTEQKLGEKRATKTDARSLDNDVTKRLSDAAAKRPGKNGS